MVYTSMQCLIRTACLGLLQARIRFDRRVQRRTDSAIYGLCKYHFPKKKERDEFTIVRRIRNPLNRFNKRNSLLVYDGIMIFKMRRSRLRNKASTSPLSFTAFLPPFFEDDEAATTSVAGVASPEALFVFETFDAEDGTWTVEGTRFSWVELTVLITDVIL
jgi:hypothetical protein